MRYIVIVLLALAACGELTEPTPPPCNRECELLKHGGNRIHIEPDNRGVVKP